LKNTYLYHSYEEDIEIKPLKRINEELEKYFKIFNKNKSKQIGLNRPDKVLKELRNKIKTRFKNCKACNNLYDRKLYEKHLLVKSKALANFPKSAIFNIIFKH
jgi:hypothetical protein